MMGRRDSSQVAEHSARERGTWSVSFGQRSGSVSSHCGYAVEYDIDCSGLLREKSTLTATISHMSDMMCTNLFHSLHVLTSSGVVLYISPQTGGHMCEVWYQYHHTAWEWEKVCPSGPEGVRAELVPRGWAEHEQCSIP